MMKAILLCMAFLARVLGEIAEDNPINIQSQNWLNSLFKLPDGPRIRKEYRLLTDEERNKFHDAINQMKNDTSVSPNKYTLLTSLHSRRSTRNSAHRGPGFVGWHRVFMLLMENALRQIDSEMTLPYWDVTLEAELDKPRRSVLFTEDFMGNGDGYVKTGPFTNWTVQDGLLYRTVGRRYSPMDDKNISVIFAHKYLSDISYPNAGITDDNLTNYELVHNRVHNWVGGEMDIIETAADDPIFFIYHCFIDYVYEKFRANQRASGVDPVTDWSTYYGAARHHLYSPMGIGNLMAADGNSEVFARDIVYLDKPSCSRENPDCGSPYLWCNVTRERCVPWTKKEFLDMKYVAKQNNKSLLEEINIHIEYRIQQEFENIKELENPTNQLSDNKTLGKNDNANQNSLVFEQQGDGDALVNVEIAMIVFVACLGCYAAFLITVKRISRTSGTSHKNSNSYTVNGVLNNVDTHNKDITENNIITDISKEFLDSDKNKKVYNLNQGSNGASDVIRRVSFRDDNDHMTEERYVIRLDIKKNSESGPYTTRERADVTNSDTGVNPIYENTMYSTPKKISCAINSNTTESCTAAGDTDTNISEKQDQTITDTSELNTDKTDVEKPQETQTVKLEHEADNTSLSGGIFTSLGPEFFPEERL